MKLAQLNWPDMEKVSRDLVVIFPIGSFEQHGPHLPFVTDTAEVTVIVDHLDEAIPDDILCLPTQWLGYSPHHMRFKGTITAKSETHINIIVETVSCMIDAGFNRIIVLNGHGGNVPNMGVALQRLMEAYPEANVYGINWYEFDELEKIREAGPHGWGHAGEMETSVMMTAHPDLVKTDRFQKDGFPPKSEFDSKVTQFKRIDQITARGNYGDPNFASAEKGERFLKAAVDALIGIVEDIKKGAL